MNKAQTRSAFKLDLFANATRKQKIETLGGPLPVIAPCIDFDHLTQIIDQPLPRSGSNPTRGGRAVHPTAAMARTCP